MNLLDEYPNFQLSENNKIDSRKYTLFDVQIDPRLDALSIIDRLDILNSYIEDADVHCMTANRRYAIDGVGTERTVFDPSTNGLVKMVNFSSNDYLNMSQHPRVIAAAMDALRQYGAGSGASCNAAGRTKMKVDLEAEIADTFEYEGALVYPTGFMTNTGVLNAVLRKNDVAILDMLSHASIMDGVECRNKLFFLHNDMQSLESTLSRAKRQYSNMVVVTDGVFSMDGDIANLPEIAGLCKKYSALLMVDEAHAFGVLGKNGLGMADHFNMPPDTIDILVGTFSKSIGSAGGFVTGSKALVTYLRFGSRPYIFTTAPFVPAMAAALESIRVIKEDSERRANLWRNIRYFKSKLKANKFNIGNAETSIFPVILGNHNRVLDVARIMGMNGVLATGFPYPIVARKQTRVRMTVTAGMTLEQLDKGHDVLCNAIAQSEASEKVMVRETIPQ